MRTMRSLVCAILATLFVTSCSTEFELNAPPKDIWVIYSVLNAKADSQLIRVSLGYLPESDALVYARENDLSARGLRVVVQGNGRTYEAVELDSVVKVPEDGIFYPITTSYMIRTEGNLALEEGERYEVQVFLPDGSDQVLTASTTIPETPRFSRPTLTPGPGLTRCLREIPLDDPYTVTFNSPKASGWELRAYLDYSVDGEERTAVYGPTALFTQNVRCSGEARCYEFREKELLQGFFNIIEPTEDKVYTYPVNVDTRCNEVPARLPISFRFEATAMDAQLTNYRLANNPAFTDLNTVRPEFSNVSAPEDVLGVGIVGSINSGIAIGKLDPCSEWLLQLNETTRPSGPCEL